VCTSVTVCVPECLCVCVSECLCVCVCVNSAFFLLRRIVTALEGDQSAAGAEPVRTPWAQHSSSLSPFVLAHHLDKGRARGEGGDRGEGWRIQTSPVCIAVRK
jgi:hypothetical protein